MHRHWKQFGNVLVLVSAMILSSSAVQVSALLQAPSRAPTASIDQNLLTKANAGDAKSQELMGQAYANGEGVPKDYQQAAFWFRKAADQGNATAQYNLGALYATGRGEPQDFAQSAIWFRKSAEHGSADAQSTLGSLYQQGQGLPRDESQALARYLKPAAPLQ